MENNFILKYFIQSIIVFIAILLLPSIALSASGINSSLSGPNNLNQGLVGWWTFDGPDMIQNVKDKSGNGNNGAMIGFTSTSTAVTAGKVGQGLKFDGGNDYVRINMNSGLPVCTMGGICSVSMWVNGSANDGQYIWSESNSVGSPLYGLIKDNTVCTGKHIGGLCVFIRSDTSSIRLLQASTATVFDNKWHHIVWIDNAGADGTALYVDGIEDTSNFTYSSAGTMTISTNCISALCRGSNSNFTNVKTDDLRIYNRALSQQEITELYNATKGSKINTPSSFDSINNNLAAYWTFDGANLTQNVRDTSGNGKHGYFQYFGATSTVVRQGKVGQALTFDGNVTSIGLISNPITTVSNPSSSCAWVYNKDLTFSSGGWNQTFLNFYVDASNGIRMGSMVNDGKFIVPYRSGGVSKGSQSSSAVFSNNTWVHVCYVFDGNNVDLYKDGLSIATSTNTDSPGGASVLGAFDAEGNGNWYGYLDDIRVYNRALSATEIKKVYDSSKSGKQNISFPGPSNLNQGLVGWWTFDGPDMIQNVKDKSGNGNNGAMIGFTSTSTAVKAGKVGQGLKFDGRDDYITISNTSSIQNIWDGGGTISYWVNPKSAGEGEAGFWIGKNWVLFAFSSHFVGETGFEFNVTFSGNTGKWKYNGTTPPISFNKWHHIVLSYNSDDTTNVPSLYIDGIFYQLPTAITPIGTRSDDSASAAIIGGNTAGSRTSNGLMDDIRIYNRALSATEVRQLYNMGR